MDDSDTLYLNDFPDALDLMLTEERPSDCSGNLA
jgi:hypothetical protein